MLIAENFGILALFQALIAENFGVLALLGEINTFGKNKHFWENKHRSHTAPLPSSLTLSISPLLPHPTSRIPPHSSLTSPP